MAKPQTTTLSIRFDSELLSHLKALAHTFSLKQGKEIRYTDLIRQAVEKQYAQHLDRTSKSA